MNNKEYTIEELRAERRREAELRGTTLEAECDEMEHFTGSKAYADVLRLLLGVSTEE